MLVLLVSCKVQQVSITHVEWKLIKMGDVDLSALDQPVTLTLDETNNKVSGYAGCNRFFGTYQSKDANISFTGMGSTKMFCQDSMAVEDAYFKALDKVQSFKTSGDKLYFLVDGSVVLEFSNK
jgi:heat shock protein HslJ